MARPEDWGDAPENSDNGQSQQQRRMPSEEETRQEGRELFEHFVQQNLISRGIQDPSMIYNYAHPNGPGGDSVSRAGMSQQMLRQYPQSYAQAESMYSGHCELDSRRVRGYSNPEWESIGRNMNSLMEQFARSPQRMEVERLARTITIDGMNEQAFMSFLTGYMTDGKNIQLRIIGLFFFCSDIIYRAVQDVAIDYGRRFMQWSLRFIMERLTTWVIANGGWAEVFQAHASTIVVSFVFGMLGMATILFLSKWWSR